MATSREDTGPTDDELLPEYDFRSMRGVVRGKYAARYRAGTNLVLLSPDVARHFPTGRAVNAALRKLIHRAKIVRRGR